MKKLLKFFVTFSLVFALFLSCFITPSSALRFGGGEPDPNDDALSDVDPYASNGTKLPTPTLPTPTEPTPTEPTPTKPTIPTEETDEIIDEDYDLPDISDAEWNILEGIEEVVPETPDDTETYIVTIDNFDTTAEYNSYLQELNAIEREAIGEQIAAISPNLPTIERVQIEKDIEHQAGPFFWAPRFQTSFKGTKGRTTSYTPYKKRHKTIINGKLRNKSHPVTGIKIDKDGFPVFKSYFTITLKRSLVRSSNYHQFKACNASLKAAIKKDSVLRNKFTSSQIQDIKNGITPNGKTWHHHQITGKMQLVDSWSHGKTGHTGGRSIWANTK